MLFRSGISIIFDTDVEEKIVACDAEKMERVMLNLLSNAIKYTEPGGTIEVSIYDRDESITISVKDTGIGIPGEKLSIIFQRFRQVESLLTRKREGSGIGLSLVKSIVELHGGSITVESQENEGTEFKIEIPVKLATVEDAQMEIAATSDINVERIAIEFSDIYN